MDPLMGIVGSLLVAKWSVGLLKQTSQVLLDYQASETLISEVRGAIEGDEHSQISDLHVWLIGPNRYSVIVALVSETPDSVAAYRSRLDPDKFSHVTVQVDRL